MTTHTKDQLRNELPLLNRTVAELMGWTDFRDEIHPAITYHWGHHTTLGTKIIPDFTGSLDSCRLFEEGLTREERRDFDIALCSMEKPGQFTWELSPVDHCIAFACLRGVCE